MSSYNLFITHSKPLFTEVYLKEITEFLSTEVMLEDVSIQFYKSLQYPLSAPALGKDFVVRCMTISPNISPTTFVL